MLQAAAATAGSNIVCPLHRWTYDLQGRAARRAALRRRPVPEPAQLRRCRTGTACCSSGNGRDVAADLAELGPRADLDFSGYVLDRVEMHECDYNWKTFIEVYLEDYHVGPFHPGLGQLRHLRRPALGVRPRLLGADRRREQRASRKPGIAVYQQAGTRRCSSYRNGEPPKHGAIWLTYYPNVMVEWYPHVLVVSTLYPRGPQKTLNVVEFYYPEEIAAVRARVRRGRSRPRTWRPASRTTRSRCAWTPAAAR